MSPVVLAESQENLQDKLSDIQSELKDNQTQYDDLQSKIDVYKENLKSKQQEKVTLESQLEVLDQDMELTKSEIEQTTIEIQSLGLEIDSLQIKINNTQDDIDQNTDYMTKLIRDLYDYDQRTYLEIALSHDTLSDFSNQVEYTETVNNEFQSAVAQLKKLKKQLREDKDDVSEKHDAEEQKKDELQAREETLHGESQYKESLLIDVEEDEEKFQQLIQDIQAEQNAYNAEISRLEKSARTTLDKLNQSSGDESSTTDTLPTEFDPMWPVSGVVTTTFHDPGYIFRSYFEHDAIDIAAPQGTALKAADSGVVAVVKYDGTSNYAYVMIVHADNFATIYGHVSAVYVEPDQVVQKGQTIAAIGGLPGTPGAGRFTTGPHVHFGVRLNGIPVDPLLYLP
ncbi:MAG: Peptidase M23B [uncultured bacterium]|nr:MAG: Peptidase M23B [uncultured bacterium]